MNQTESSHQTDIEEEQQSKIVVRVSENLLMHQEIMDEIARKLTFVLHRHSKLRDLIGFLCYTDRAPDLIVIDHSILTAHDVERTILTLQTLMRIRFDDAPYKLAVRLTGPLERHWVKTYKNLGLSGMILPTAAFNFHLNLKGYQDLLYEPGESWPREGIQSTAQISKTRTADEFGINLTERQQQVKRLLCERGLSNKAIARQLNISESTVKIHVSAILKRYAVRNRTQLALAAKNQSRL